MANLCVALRLRPAAAGWKTPSLSRLSSRFLIVFLAVIGFTLGCAHGDGREVPGDREREVGPRATGTATAAEESGRDGAIAEPAPEREIDEDSALAFDPGANTPRRGSSLRVMEEGKGYLIAGRAREAARRFTRAVQIDPTNGFAYYYLGRARIASGDRASAIGVLQKAESLLGPYPEWRERTVRLLASLGAR